MLSVFRSNSSNVFMALILGAMIFVFVFTFGSWGGGNLSGDMPVAAAVNGKIIPLSSFRVQYAQAFRTQQMFRQGFTADQAREEQLDDKVLDRLVGTELLAQAAEARGFAVSDDEVADAIQKRFFGKDKPFDPEEYKRIVNGAYNTTESRFEGQLRREILAARMEAALSDAARVSESELKEQFDGKNDRADIDFVKIDPLFFKAKVKDATDDEVKAWVTANKADVEKFYNEHMNRYRQPKKVNARHILAKFESGASDADKAKAKEKIEAALKRVQGGEDFAKVATEVSEDSSASQGGSLGFFGPGAMVKPFEDAAFALKKDEISGVVESRFGYHVIKVDEIQDAVTKELAVVENEIGKQLMRERGQKDLAKKLADEALTQLKAGKALTELKLEGLVLPPKEGEEAKKGEDVDPFAPRVESTGEFARSSRVVPRIGVSPELMDLAFKTLTMDKPLHEGVVEVGNRLFLVKLKSRVQPDPSKFAEERDQLEQQLLSGRKSKLVDEFTKALREKARIEKQPNLLSNRNM